jgi:hypothetical protein
MLNSDNTFELMLLDSSNIQEGIVQCICGMMVEELKDQVSSGGGGSGQSNSKGPAEQAKPAPQV